MQTPVLYIESKIVRAKLAEFAEAAPDVHLFYAIKANPHSKLLSLLAEQNIGFEISSSSELDLLQSLGIAADRIISSNTIKSPAFIQEAHEYGIEQFVADSVEELRKIARWAPTSKIMIRVEVDNSGSVWPLEDKFGASREEAIQLAHQAKASGLDVTGLTFHVGSQCVSIDSWRSAIVAISDLWHELIQEGFGLSILNIGGGFPSRYRSPVPSISDILTVIMPLLEKEIGPHVALQAEPGRALVGEAGTLVTTVIGKREHRGTSWLYVDVGAFNGLAEVLGGIQYAFSLCEQTSKAAQKTWVIAGPTCDSMDVIARDVVLTEPSVGDLLLVSTTGAYTTAYASSFNGAPVPQVSLVDRLPWQSS